VARAATGQRWRGLVRLTAASRKRYQPNLEKRHHQLKTVLGAAPVELKSPSRIEGLACCEFVALLCQCLIERELRAAMIRESVPELALYHEGRASKSPTAARVFDLFAETTRHHLTSQGDVVQVFEPKLNDLQRQVLDLLGIPHDAYLSTTTDSWTGPLTRSQDGADIAREKCGTRVPVARSTAIAPFRRILAVPQFGRTRSG
jgi:hypothetical protein